MKIDITDLTVFIAIAETGNLTKGARKVFISPAAASIRIKSLEAQLGSRLLYRHNKGVDLTPAGKHLLQQARVIKQQIEQIKNQFSNYKIEEVGHIRLFANTTAITEFLPNILSQFLAKSAAITIDLQEHLTKDIIRGVLDNAADIGILAGDINAIALESIHFSTDRLVVVVPEGHYLGKKSSVCFSDTLNYPYIGIHSGSTLQMFLTEKLAKMGMEVAQRINVYGFDSVCRLIESGVGIGIVPESAAKRHSESMAIQLVYLDEDWAERKRHIIIKERAALSPVVERLIQTIIDKTKS